MRCTPIAILLWATLASCQSGIEPFVCETSSECGDDGRCELSGGCSFADEACSSGWRYGAGATRASECVEASDSRHCFEETGHCIEGEIAQYFRDRGGRLIHGLPISELALEDVGGLRLAVQWFERSRLEIHPDGVKSGRLGDEYLLSKGTDFHSMPTAPPDPTCRYFEVTEHNLCGAFLEFWDSEGGLESFGYPLLEAELELVGEETITVQYTERKRYELRDGRVVLAPLGRLLRE